MGVGVGFLDLLPSPPRGLNGDWRDPPIGGDLFGSGFDSGLETAPWPSAFSSMDSYGLKVTEDFESVTMIGLVDLEDFGRPGLMVEDFTDESAPIWEQVIASSCRGDFSEVPSF